jgi:Transposase DDE domain group 1
MNLPAVRTHQKGERSTAIEAIDNFSENTKLSVDTFGGRVHVEWDPQAAVTPLGQLPFFIEFLKLGDLFNPWVEDCPLYSLSPNAPSKRDVLGTLLLSILAGHRRYAHVTTIRSDSVNPGLLGMEKIVSEDSLRRSLLKIPEEEGAIWFQKHYKKCYGPLLLEPWIMDIDTTVKVLYGKQEGAVVGYNPKKPGRPSHTYHTYFMANLRLVLEVEVQPGNQMAASYTAPGLFSLIDSLPQECRPTFLRGDIAFGTDGVMSEAEARGLGYLFKLKLTNNATRLIKKLMGNSAWTKAGHGWEGQESSLKLVGWKASRRVIVLRRPLSQEKDPKAQKLLSAGSQPKQLGFNFGEIEGHNPQYTYAVLVTSLPDEVLTIAQHYRDRADCENIFDELKNQWGWGGYTTQDLHRCRLVARAVGLIYNWWNLYVRLADPDKHLEGITSRPLLLYAVAKQTSHAGQTHLKITSTHGRADRVRQVLSRITNFFEFLKACTEQLTSEQLWYRILSKALEKFLGGRILQPPLRLPETG